MSKNKKILKMLSEKKKGLKKHLKDEEQAFSKLYKKKNKSVIDIEMLSGHNYTIGYCTAVLSLSKEIVSLLKMSEEEIDDLIKENKKISKQNKKHMKEILDGIKKDK